MFEYLNGRPDEVFDEIYRALQIYPDSIKKEVGLKKWRDMAVILMDFLDDAEIGDKFAKHIEKNCAKRALRLDEAQP